MKPLALAVLVMSLLVVSSCGEGYYRDKLVDDAKSSFDISTEKAECFVDALADATGYEYEKIWGYIDVDPDDSYEDWDSSAKRLGNAFYPSARKCRFDP